VCTGVALQGPDNVSLTTYRVFLDGEIGRLEQVFRIGKTNHLHLSQNDGMVGLTRYDGQA
jgi:hypothetical protein